MDANVNLGEDEDKLDAKALLVHIYYLKDMLQQRCDSLEYFLQQKIDGNDLRYAQRYEAQQATLAASLLAADRAVAKAEVSTTARFEAGNELRAQLDKQATTLLSRAEYQLHHTALAERVDSLTQQIVLLDKRSVEWVAMTQGKSSGVGLSWAVLLGAAGLVSTVVAMIFSFIH